MTYDWLDNSVINNYKIYGSRELGKKSKMH